MPVTELTDTKGFDEAIGRQDEDLIVIDFSAVWCGPCKIIAPKFEQMSNEYSNCHFYKVDIDDLEEVTSRSNISAVPTFITYKKGEEVDRVSGASESNLRKMIEDNGGVKND